jgi:UDP-2-acetamido-3-amino-2,3-dideoxy-glucuronate N-acetyltransferase
MTEQSMSSNEPRTPRVAVIGAGYWGKNLVRNFHALGALAAIQDADTARMNELATQTGARPAASVDEVLADANIDAVVISTPAETHYDLVRQALRAGKDVFVEKPLCLTQRDGEELVKLADDSDRILMVGHLLWYHPAILRLKELIDAGELGRIQYIYSNRLNLGKIRREENILWSFAPHDLSVIIGLLGESPTSVVAQGGNYLHSNIADVTVSLLSFPSGVKAHVFVSWLHPFKEQKLVVVGDRKMAVFNDLETKDKLVLYPHSIEWKNQMPVPNKADAEVEAIESYEPLRAECDHFLESVRTRKKPRTDGAEGLRVLKVLEQCQQALGVVAPAVAKEAAPAPAAKKPYFAHESAFIDDGVEIGEGTSIWHVTHVLKGSKLGKNCKIGQNVVIGPRVNIGNGVKIQNNVSVYEGVTLEDHVFCGPSMVFTNVFNPRSEIVRMNEIRETRVKRGVSIGANATIVCGTTIGEYAFIGAGTVVTKDVPAYALVVGNPGRVTGFVCSCGNKLPKGEGRVACPACSKQYENDGRVVTPVEAAMAGQNS